MSIWQRWSRHTRNAFLSTLLCRCLTAAPRSKKQPAHSVNLGAAGIGLFSNHEEIYLGNLTIKLFFAWLGHRNTSIEIIFVHPNEPVLDRNGTLYLLTLVHIPSAIDVHG